MIIKTSAGYQVTSEKGKPMSKKNLSRVDAEKRLRQIEYFKHRTESALQRWLDSELEENS